ncbi:hypothetical protein [Rhodoferax sp.]|jgi:hypothetical protein|uniref:hypothetical protein n=1 Tax=Rhodoferax sp. TaxID=50421 RepID=UPI0037839663
MLEEKLKRLGSLGASGRRHQDQREQLDALCDWIDRHIDQPIGWQELIAQTGWDYQEIQTVFYRYKCTTAMTWIRLRREMRTSAVDVAVQRLFITDPKPERT